MHSQSSFVVPITPLCVKSGITVITENTSKEQARIWLAEIESLYNAHHNEAEPTWTWDHVHDLDRDAMVELEEIIGASDRYPLTLELISTFRDQAWRRLYQHTIGYAYPTSANAVVAGFGKTGCYVYQSLGVFQGFPTLEEVKAKAIAAQTTPTRWSIDHPENEGTVKEVQPL